MRKRARVRWRAAYCVTSGEAYECGVKSTMCGTAMCGRVRAGRFLAVVALECTNHGLHCAWGLLTWRIGGFAGVQVGGNPVSPRHVPYCESGPTPKRP